MSFSCCNLLTTVIVFPSIRGLLRDMCLPRSSQLSWAVREHSGLHGVHFAELCFPNARSISQCSYLQPGQWRPAGISRQGGVLLVLRHCVTVAWLTRWRCLFFLCWACRKARRLTWLSCLALWLVCFNSSECSCQPQLCSSSTGRDCLVQTKSLPALLRVEPVLHIKIFL